MRNALMATAMLAAIGCLAGAPANAASSSAMSVSGSPHRAQLTDVSAAHRYYRHHRGYYGRGYAYDPSGVNAGSRPGSLLNFYRRNNICAIDEGYGRVTRCD